MKKIFLWIPVFFSLSLSTLFSGCVSLKTIDEILIGGAVLAVGGVLSLFKKKDKKKQETPPRENKQQTKSKEEVKESKTTTIAKDSKYYIFNVTFDNFKEKFTEKEFSENTFDNVINVSGNYNEELFRSMIQFLQDKKRLVVNLSNVQNITQLPEDAFLNCYTLKKVVLPSTINAIGKGTFYCCKNLESIELPENVTYIGEVAFLGCEKITAITIPENVTHIGKSAFYECKKLSEITLGKNISTIEDAAFFNCFNIKKITILGNITSIGDSIFYECNSVKKVIIESDELFTEESFCNIIKQLKRVGKNVGYDLDISKIKNITKLPEQIFEDHRNINTILLPQTIEIIGKKAFANCDSLTYIQLPQTITKIEEDAFAKCYSLQGIELSENITSIKKGTFNYCSKLEKVVIPKNVTTIGDYAFWHCESLLSLEIKGNLESIEKSAFENCSALETITLGGRVKNIGDCAFFDCKKLKQLSLATGTESIGLGAFKGCTELESLKLPNTLKTIGNCFIDDCPKMTTITLPNSLDIPEIDAIEWFYKNKYIKEIVLEEGITSFFMNSTECSSLERIVIPSTLTPNRYGNFGTFNDSPLLKFDVSSNNKNFSTMQDGAILLSKDKKKIYAWPSASGKIKIPDEVENFDWLIFYKNKNIEEITFSKNMEHYTDLSCEGVKTLIIPEGVKEIISVGNFNCENLELLQIPSTLTFMGRKEKYSPSVIQIPTCTSSKLKFKVAKDNPLFSTSKDGAMLFSKDKKKLYSYPSATGDIILPNTITIIGNQAFTPSKVKTLTITSKEIRIQSEAFARCETLESVTVQGDVIAERDNFGYSFDTRIFTGCTNLKEINFEGSVSSIDQSFEGCKNLTRFSIPKGITHIAMETFTNCENITFDVSKNNNFITSEDGTKLMSADGKCLIFWTSASGDVIIPDGVEELYTEVFSTCKNPVTSITLPKSLKDMGGHYDPCALSYLWPNLKKINFAGTKEQWESILNNMNPFTRVDMQRIPTTYNYKK